MRLVRQSEAAPRQITIAFPLRNSARQHQRSHQLASWWLLLEVLPRQLSQCDWSMTTIDTTAATNSVSVDLMSGDETMTTTINIEQMKYGVAGRYDYRVWVGEAVAGIALHQRDSESWNVYDVYRGGAPVTYATRRQVQASLRRLAKRHPAYLT